MDTTFDLVLAGQASGTNVAYGVTDASDSWTATTAAQADLTDGSDQFRAVVTDAVNKLS